MENFIYNNKINLNQLLFTNMPYSISSYLHNNYRTLKIKLFFNEKYRKVVFISAERKLFIQDLSLCAYKDEFAVTNLRILISFTMRSRVGVFVPFS